MKQYKVTVPTDLLQFIFNNRDYTITIAGEEGETYNMSYEQYICLNSRNCIVGEENIHLYHPFWVKEKFDESFLEMTTKDIYNNFMKEYYCFMTIKSLTKSYYFEKTGNLFINIDTNCSSGLNVNDIESHISKILKHREYVVEVDYIYEFDEDNTPYEYVFKYVTSLNAIKVYETTGSSGGHQITSWKTEKEMRDSIQDGYEYTQVGVNVRIKEDYEK